MQLSVEIIRFGAALLAGTAIGYAFGRLQEAAARRYERRQQNGLLHNGWSIMPGSMTRVAMLLLALVLAQVVCPLLFTNYSQWVVSGGIVAGYAMVLLQQLRRRLAMAR